MVAQLRQMRKAMNSRREEKCGTKMTVQEKRAQDRAAERYAHAYAGGVIIIIIQDCQEISKKLMHRLRYTICTVQYLCSKEESR